MKTKLLFLLPTSCLLALGAWLVNDPHPAQADEIPEKYRDTVKKGLEYLVKHQHKDGHWEGDGGKHPVAMTALVGIALLMDGTAELDTELGEKKRPRQASKYSANIDKAVNWLVAQSRAKREGLIYSEHPSETARYMEGHGLATLFLAGVLGHEKDKARRDKLSQVLTRSVKYIVKARSSQGGWYHTSKMEGHDFDAISATVIQIQALQAAELAGIPVPAGIIHQAQQYMTQAVGKHERKAKQGQNRALLADTAAGLASQFEILGGTGQNKDEVWVKRLKRLNYCRTEMPKGRAIQLGRDELTQFYYAQVLFNFEFGVENWKEYRTVMFDHLQVSQKKDGSWPAGDGLGVGPVYSTAIWCSLLQIDKGNYPLTLRVPRERTF